MLYSIIWKDVFGTPVRWLAWVGGEMLIVRNGDHCARMTRSQASERLITINNSNAWIIDKAWPHLVEVQ